MSNLRELLEGFLDGVSARHDALGTELKLFEGGDQDGGIGSEGVHQFEIFAGDAEQGDGLVVSQAFGQEFDEQVSSVGSLVGGGVQQVEDHDGQPELMGVVEGEIGITAVEDGSGGSVGGGGLQFFEEGDGLLLAVFFQAEGAGGEAGDGISMFAADYDRDEDQIGAGFEDGGGGRV